MYIWSVCSYLIGTVLTTPDADISTIRISEFLSELQPYPNRFHGSDVDSDFSYPCMVSVIVFVSR